MSKLQYNVEAIVEPKLIDVNTIEGFIEGRKVVVSRRLSGFKVNLAIKIEDRIVHDSDVTPDCVAFFNKLTDEAHRLADSRHAESEKRILPALAKLVTIV